MIRHTILEVMQKLVQWALGMPSDKLTTAFFILGLSLGWMVGWIIGVGIVLGCMILSGVYIN